MNFLLTPWRAIRAYYAPLAKLLLVLIYIGYIGEKEEISRKLDSTEIRLHSVISLEEKVNEYREQNKRLRG